MTKLCSPGLPAQDFLSLSYGFLATTNDLIALDLATAFSSGDNSLKSRHFNPPAECGIQQKCSLLNTSKPALTNGAVYSSKDGT